MTDSLFLAELADPLPELGALVELTGDEGRHAAVVKRIGVGERVIISDGAGRAIQGTVRASTKSGLSVEVTEQVIARDAAVRFVAVQALAKGDRSELAIEMLTEVGVDEIIPWQASRSIVRWSAERGAKSLSRWRSTVREATKQSRRLRTPEVTEMATTKQLQKLIMDADLALVLHEDAESPLGEVDLPATGRVLLIVGPEGGISPDELEAFAAAGAVPVSISDAVLRTSTAGVVALAGLKLRCNLLS